MGFQREIFAGGYIDQNGLVSSTGNGQGGGNGVMYMGEFEVILARINELTEAMKAYWIAEMTKCEVRKGCIRRSPDNDRDDEGPDDYHGYLAASKFVDPSRARAFLLYGLLHMFIYDANKSLSFKDFLLRFPQLFSMALMASNFPLIKFRLFFIIPLLYHVLKDVPTSDTDARRLGWLLIQSWDGKGLLSKFVVSKWKAKLLREYPNGMKDVYGKYYSSGHPFITYVPTF